MKSKKFDKRLSLNKKTISDLNFGEMNRAYGGAATNVAYRKTVGVFTPPPTCYTCIECPPVDSKCPVYTCLEC